MRLRCILWIVVFVFMMIDELAFISFSLGKRAMLCFLEFLHHCCSHMEDVALNKVMLFKIFLFVVTLIIFCNVLLLLFSDGILFLQFAKGL